MIFRDENDARMYEPIDLSGCMREPIDLSGCMREPSDISNILLSDLLHAKEVYLQVNSKLLFTSHNTIAYTYRLYNLP